MEAPLAVKAHGADGEIRGVGAGLGGLTGGEHHGPLPRGVGVQRAGLGRRLEAGVLDIALAGVDAGELQRHGLAGVQALRAGLQQQGAAFGVVRDHLVAGASPHSRSGALQPAGDLGVTVEPVARLVGEGVVHPGGIAVADRLHQLQPEALAGRFPLHLCGKGGVGPQAGLQRVPQGGARRHGGDAQGGAQGQGRGRPAAQPPGPPGRRALLQHAVEPLHRRRAGPQPVYLPPIVVLKHRRPPSNTAAAAPGPGTAWT